MTSILTSSSAVSLNAAEVTLGSHDGSRTFLLLHGGGGPRTMTGFADLLAQQTHSRVLLPTHPGFAGTARPVELDSARRLAATYVELIERLDLADVTVIGNSFGGWLAAEIALLGCPSVSEVVIVDGVGIDVSGHDVKDLRGLSAAEVATFSWHDPSKAPVPTTTAAGPSPDLLALLGYAPTGMTDPTLLGRLNEVELGVHVIWGDSDRIVDPEYGRAFAGAIPGATFTVLERTGHLPQLETPDQLLSVVRDLTMRAGGRHADTRSASSRTPI